VLLVLTAINASGIRAGKRVNNALMAVKVAGILALVAIAFLRTGSPASTYDASALASPGASWAGLLFTALVPIMFAYGGWQNCGIMAGEIRDPGRCLPRAVVLGVLLVIVLYVGLNLAYLRVLTPAQMAASTALASDAARVVAGETGARFVAALILVSALGFLAVIVLTAPRLYYAMARDGLFFSRFADLSEGTRVPVWSLGVQAIWSSLLAVSGTYDQLTDSLLFASWIFYGLVTSSVFVLRRKLPHAPRPYRTPGYPIVPLVFVLVAAWLVVNTLLNRPVESVAGLVLIALGLPIYFYYRRRAFQARAGR